ncbi:hypothetical protein GCM10011578_050880 [Streptomyces fuscichromogenes]|uniref:DUF3891 family protein n=2 Tax=Streptomyces fuscichromogenes TaxID=1324013 RepID=A0A917XFE5_9ACTN|nr:hypothetical protein GCM10011578_050880 [Streptomyces fuscichromogenes]
MAGDIAARWGNDDFALPTPHDKATLATAMHDDGWREPDLLPLFNDVEHRPMHFLEISMEEHVKLYSRGVDEVFAADPYAGLLISMHWTGLYRARWGLQPGGIKWGTDGRQDEAVLAEEQRWIEVKRTLMQGMIRSDLEQHLWHNYDLLQAWDLLSLYASVCDTTPGDGPTAHVFDSLASIDHAPGPRTIPSVPVAVGQERVELTLTAVRPGVVELDPYPFDVDELPVTVPSRVIPDRPYSGPDDARGALAVAAVENVECIFVRPGRRS